MSDSSGNETEHYVKNIKFKPVISALLLWCGADAVNKSVFEENAASKVHQKYDWAGFDSCNLPCPYWIHIYCCTVVFICSFDYLLAGKTLALHTLGRLHSSCSQSQLSVSLQPRIKKMSKIRDFSWMVMADVILATIFLRLDSERLMC